MLINIQNLTFCYDGSYDNVFENVSLQLDTDWRLGLTGRNGRGKTTLMRLLMGEHEYQGRIDSPAKFEYFPYNITDRSMTVQAFFEQNNPDSLQWEIDRELSLLEVDESVPERSFDTLSNGEQTKVQLASLFLRENSFLLIDEPTNHLDTEGRELLADYLSRKQGFILISHDRRFLDSCVDHMLAINRKNIELCKGNFTTWYDNKQQRDNWELAENARLKGDIKRLKTAARRTKEWSDNVERSKIGTHCADRGAVGHKAAKMMQRSKNLEKRQTGAIEEKSELLRNIEEVESLKLHLLDYPKQRLLTLRELSIGYDGRTVFDGATLELMRGDRVAICGSNGSGKSSILKLLLGEAVPHGGTVELGSSMCISYVPQDSSFLAGSLDDLITERGVDGTLLKAILRKLDFARVQFEKPMQDYSAGQKKKVLLAASLATQAHLYLWDEPLNYIDVFSRMQLETLLCEYAPTMIFVEHDSAFVDAVATKRLVL